MSKKINIYIYNIYSVEIDRYIILAAHRPLRRPQTLTQDGHENASLKFVRRTRPSPEGTTSLWCGFDSNSRMSRAPLSRVFARPCLPNTRSPQCLAPLDHTAYADQWRQGACARVRGGVVRSFSRPSISPVHLMCMRVRAQSSLSPIISQPNHLSLPMARRAAWRAFGRFGEDTFKMTGLLALTNSDSDAAAGKCAP